MRFEDSNYSKILDYKKVTLDSGNYYLCENFVIGEVSEGTHYDWNLAQDWIHIAIEYYGDTLKIGYISNRINSYSIEPQLWTILGEEFNFLVAGAIIIYNNISYVSASIEKRFSKNSIKRCKSLNEAIDWMNNLVEFKP